MGRFMEAVGGIFRGGRKTDRPVSPQPEVGADSSEKKRKESFDWESIPVGGRLRIVTQNTEYILERSPNERIQTREGASQSLFTTFLVAEVSGGSAGSSKKGTKFYVVTCFTELKVDSGVAFSSVENGKEVMVHLSKVRSFEALP